LLSFPLPLLLSLSLPPLFRFSFCSKTMYMYTKIRWDFHKNVSIIIIQTKKEYGYELYNIWIRISISSLYNNVSKQKRNKKKQKTKIYNFAHSPRVCFGRIMVCVYRYHRCPSV
jgi:hypothetical protein